MKGRVATHCYLCGKVLGGSVNRDHVPPQQFYAHVIRRTHCLNLLTLPVHSKCNRSYQADEDYFANTLAPFAKGSEAGNAYWHEVFTKYGHGKKRGLVHKVIDEFDKRPSGLVLPPGVVVKRFEGERLNRVAWKIIRGLHYHHHDEIAAEGTPHLVRVVLPDQPPPAEFAVLSQAPSHGAYPGVFDYRFVSLDSPKLNYWAMLLWDKIILLMAFHKADCACEECRAIACPRSLTPVAV